MSALEVSKDVVLFSKDVATTRRWMIPHAAFAEFLRNQGVPIHECVVDGDGETWVRFDGATSSARCTQGALVVETTLRERVAP